MSIEWEQEANAAGERSIMAQAAAHEQKALAASCLARAHGAAASRVEGEPTFWSLRAAVHELRQGQLETEAEAEAKVELHARSHAQSE